MHMSSVDDVLRRMDSQSRRILSDAIKEYERKPSSATLKEIADILRNWNEDEAKILLPEFMKRK